MKKYYKLIMDSDLSEVMSVSSYDMADFNLISLWKGEKINEYQLNGVQLLVNDNAFLKPDFLGNPISWLIFSEKFLFLVKKEIEKHCQILEAPLYSNISEALIPGYYIINVLPVVKCIDENKSEIDKSEDGSIDFVINLKIDSSLIPDGLHIFRVYGDTTSIIVSESFIEKIRGKELTGVALMEI